MLTITRRRARCLRGVFRRHALGLPTRGAVPPLVFRADNAQVRAHYRYDGLAVAYASDGEPGADGAVALPPDAPADVEGRDDSPVTIEAAAPDRTVARWADRGIPQSREYAVPPPDAIAAFPALPGTWSEAPPGLLDALAEAALTGSDDGTRYAPGCVLLRGTAGEIVATDGRQLLIQGGFRLPFEGDVLVKRSPVFANKAFPRDRPVSVGKTDANVVLRAGPWTVFLDVRADARYPRVDQVIPGPQAATTRLRLDPGDASFLAQALDRPPGADAPHGPATLDLNGRVAVRSRGPDQPRATELVLANSSYTGTPVRLSVNREYLARAVRLGFTELEVVDADSPVVLRDRHRVYGFQPLSKESAVGPADDLIRIESPSQDPRPIQELGVSHERGSPLTDKHTPVEPPPRESVRPQAGEGTDPGSLASLIREAESLLEVLTGAKARAGRLVVALRRYRRRERLVATTLASLKALNLQDVAG